MRIGDRVRIARRGRFVGRGQEVELFRAATRATEPPFAVLLVHGPGGVGKSTLLREFHQIAVDAGRHVEHVDGRDIEPSSTGFLLALSRAQGPRSVDLPDVVRRWPASGVLLIDTYETIESIDGWLRETFLPQLPASALVVIAGRNAPAAAWRTDAGWSTVARVIGLENLPPQECRTYLTLRGVAEGHHREALEFTRGHPLALSLAADVLSRSSAQRSLRLAENPDVLQGLLETFAHDIPDAEHRLALYACATLWNTTEPLLAAALDRTDVQPLFDWLRSLSFIEQGPYGLFPHDLARDVLFREFCWRNRSEARALIERVINRLYGDLVQARGLEQQRAWFSILYVQRGNPALRALFEWTTFGTAYAEPARPEDHAAILEMTERHEGVQSAGIARYWLRRQPEMFHVHRSVTGELSGFTAQIRIDQATDEDLAADPAVALAMAYARAHSPARPGEEIVYARFWMSRESYQAPSQTFTLLATLSSLYWVTHPKLAWCFAAFAEPDPLEEYFAEIQLWRTREADFAVDGRHYGVFGHDWRLENAAQWLSLKAERAARVDAEISRPRMPPAPAFITPSEAEFAEAVRDALRHYTRPDALAECLLMRSRLVASEPTAESRVARLRELLLEAGASLEKDARTRKLYDALWHTYFEPASTQERAAEELGVAFNTYRYRLAKGTEALTEWLWRRS